MVDFKLQFSYQKNREEEFIKVNFNKKKSKFKSIPFLLREEKILSIKNFPT